MDEDICKCGDYRKEHPNDGPCDLNGLGHNIPDYKCLGFEHEIKDGIQKTDWKYIELKGYMSSVSDLPRFGIKKGWRCMNCYSMVYYTKCPNDECYNFYHYINAKHCKFMKKAHSKRLDELGITKEK